MKREPTGDNPISMITISPSFGVAGSGDQPKMVADPTHPGMGSEIEDAIAGRNPGERRSYGIMRVKR